MLCFTSTVFIYLQEPNPEDPLNKEAAEVLQTNRRLFETNVQKSMRGGYIGSVSKFLVLLRAWLTLTVIGLFRTVPQVTSFRPKPPKNTTMF